MKITAAICTYNRFEDLARCLASVKKQDLPTEEYEILVIDNSLSPQESRAFRDSLQGFSNLRYLITERAGIGFARNCAAEECRTEILAFADDDCVVSSNWLREYLRAFDTMGPGAGVIGGKVEPIWVRPRPAWLVDELVQPLAMVDWGEDICFIEPPGKWLVTANAAYRIAALRKAGGFREHLGRLKNLPLAHEEYAANQAIHSLGYDLVYWPYSRVGHRVHQQRITPQWLYRDAFLGTVSFLLMQLENVDSELLNELIERLAPVLETGLEECPTVAETAQILASINEFRESAQFETTTFLEETGVTRKRREFAGSRTVYVVTPSFNAVDTIDETILSVVSQTGDVTIRYHVQDGGSTDGTVERLAEWSKRLANGDFSPACRNLVFTYHVGVDDGMYDAINRGLATMSVPGDALMTWINADDVFVPGAFASVVRVSLDCPEVAWVGSRVAVLVEGELLAVSNVAFPTELVRSGACDGKHWQHVQQEGSFWRRSLWDEAGGLNEQFRFAGDWDLWRRFAKHADPVQPEFPTAFFRMRHGQLSADNGGRDYADEIEATVPAERRKAALDELAEIGLLDAKVYRTAYSWTEHRYTTFQLCLTAETVAAHAADYLKTPNGVIDPPTPSVAVATLRSPSPEKNNDQPRPWRRLRIRGAGGVVLRLRRIFRMSYVRDVLRRSGLFYCEYYLDRNPDVREAGIDPLVHYTLCGWREGRNPNPLFDTIWYLETYDDVRTSGVNPLFHFVRFGQNEGRDPGPWFSTAAYREANPDVTARNLDPLFHYLRFGAAEGRVAEDSRVRRD